jgi:hypothetical protein
MVPGVPVVAIVHGVGNLDRSDLKSRDARKKQDYGSAIFGLQRFPAKIDNAQLNLAKSPNFFPGL